MPDVFPDPVLHSREGAATRLADCPNYHPGVRWSPKYCKCGTCAACGHTKHAAIHSACADGKPWGHGFIPR